MLKIPADRYLAVIYSPTSRNVDIGRIGKIELVHPVQHDDSCNWELKPLFVLDVLKTEDGFKTCWESGNPPCGDRGEWLVAESKRIICKSDLAELPFLGFCIDAENNLRQFDGMAHESAWLFPLLRESDDWKRADFAALVLDGAYHWPSDRRRAADAPAGPAPH